ncbi:MULTISPECIES: LCP family protein [unclassified Cryobacterium]|uniref:LCP family glycopolymer transferase n=1 Tax=unclassified Cryobacterium TaxID=2649013 RepID=UPI002AB4A98F|nr:MULTISPECIES: LCP family protein [unclassified Cryobacterium]MDY7544600.1 LCP family protein [Cryobacterium sp. 5B3]MEB0000095.1 LCP family protein [Cryobacterium sp. RTS3]MEB0266766.1 LCP family protein [Cryobacterium sp. 10I5]MEB0275962.1 LCP family protein [Cryobacterium sp. 5B3]
MASEHPRVVSASREYCNSVRAAARGQQINGPENPGAVYPDAMANGSTPEIEGMRDATSVILGIPIQNYVLFDMQGFSTLIEALDGININVETRVPVGGDENLVSGADWIEPGMQNPNDYDAMC